MKKTGVRLLALLLGALMTLSLFPAAVAADSYVPAEEPRYMSGFSGLPSGDLSAGKMTKVQIRDLLAANPLETPSVVFDETPSASYPYKPGKVKTSVLQMGANRLTALRAIAGLPAVVLDADLNTEAQYGALLLAASKFNHNPPQPADMDDTTYQRGKAATSTSNISCRLGYGTVNVITGAVDGFMDDSDGYNVQMLGHRRWQLNPTLKYVGFGYVEKPHERYGTEDYTDEKVWDTSGSGINYHFVSWPASGNFPETLFGTDQAWSVSLNPAEYQAPSLSAVSVTLKRESDGRTWTFSGSGYEPADSGKYFTVNNEGFGVANCIIFRPDGISAYDGLYTVTVSGVKNTSGGSANFSYQVEFFDPDSLPTITVTTQPKSVTAAIGQKVSVKTAATGEGLTYQWYIKNKGASKFSKSSVTSATYSVTMSESVDGRKIYCVITDAEGNTVKTNTATLTASNLAITAQPASVSAAIGATATVTVGAAGDGLTYQWYIKNKGASKFSKSSVTAAAYSVTMSDNVDGRQLYCIVKDQYGAELKTNTVTLTAAAALAITTQPKSVRVNDGAKATVSVEAVGDGLTYQWYIKNVGKTKYSKSSVTTASYSVTMSSTVNGRLLYCIVKDQYGNTVKSKTVRLYSNTLAIIQQPKNVSAAVGEQVSVKIIASGQGLSYQWYIKNVGKTKFSKSSVTSDTYTVTMTEAISGRQIYCVVTDKNGNTVKTNTVTITKK